VGTVFIAIVGPLVEMVSELELSGDRNTIRSSCVKHAVLLLARALGVTD
jgi:nicotinamide mononucleotide (NMN) deamidase PncC